MSGHHLHLDTKIGQLFLDQPRSELNGLGRDRLDGLGWRVKQAHGWQGSSLDWLDKETLLLFLLHPLGLRHSHHSGLYAHRRIVNDFFLLGLNLLMADGFGHLARAAILASVAQVTRAHKNEFERRANFFRQVEPGKPEKQARADTKQAKQDQRGSGKTNGL